MLSNTKLLSAFILLFAAIMLPNHSQAEFYRYITKDGNVYYVDDLSQVPEEYRDQIKVYREPKDSLTELEVQRLKEIEDAREQAELAAQKRSEEEKKRNSKNSETRVQIVANQVLVPVIIGYGNLEYETTLLLDTGASNIVLHTDFANAVNIGLRQRNLSRVAGGGLIHTEKAEIDYLKIGPYEFNAVTVTIINHTGPPVGYQGLLGMNVLRQTRYSIDFDNSIIRWQPQPTVQE